ncbi:MAG: T9SS type A sorting domain-containing protein [Flavobacteriales bacterium]|nr:T9SS type A sorting domain-containing protein [Flavobacteriales bacterium]
MKKLITFLTLFVFTYNYNLAQNRYFEEVFDSVNVTTNIKYADNITVVLSAVGKGPTIPTGAHALAPDLVFDFYEPNGDSLTERPLLVYLHTGTFAPRFLNNNPTGDRNDYATKTMCERFAKRGFAVANVEYRLGWNGGAGGSLEANSISLISAVYRAIQDTKAAVRYFYRDVKDSSNTYKIDTNKIALVGQGSGGWVALGYASVSDTSDLRLPKFLSPTGDMLINLDSIGDWDGYGGHPSQNIENNVGYSSKIQMVCSMAGGMGDLAWLKAGNVPMAAVHTREDNVAIYTTGDVSVTTAAGLIPITTGISGSYDVIDSANKLGNNNVLSGINDVYTTAAYNASLKLVASIDKGLGVIGQPVDNLFPFITGNTDDSAPWEYYDTAFVRIAAPQLGADPNLILAKATNDNPDMSMAKATAYMDSTLGFFCPRIVKALSLAGPTVDVIENNSYSDILIYPNPVSGTINFNATSKIKSIKIYNQLGTLVKQFNPNSLNYNFNTEEMPNGIYISQISTTEKDYVEKVILK